MPYIILGLITVLTFSYFTSTDSKLNTNILPATTLEGTISNSHTTGLATETENEIIRILLVPGHDKKSVGGQYLNLTEEKINLTLSKELMQLFKNDTEFDIVVTRDENGYSDFLNTYIDDNKLSIESFYKEKQEAIEQLVERGLFEWPDGPHHASASSEMVLRLYGINKWANENDVDIILNLHFNDDPERRSHHDRGKYEGFAIYVPNTQYDNSIASKSLANKIFEKLHTYYPISNLPQEKSGIVESHKLIAIGSYNTLNIPSVVIEYGYLYEPQFDNEITREASIQHLALQTYLGVHEFFENYNVESANRQKERKVFDELLREDNNLVYGLRTNKSVFTLQALLAYLGQYPPQEYTKRQCVLDGDFGKCTESAIKEFQKEYSLVIDGSVGSETKVKLREALSENN